MEGYEIMICRNCGNTTDDGILFCPYCGKKIEEIIDLEKKSAAVNDVFAAQQTSGSDAELTGAAVSAFTDKSDMNAAPVNPVPASTTVPPSQPVSPVTPVPAFDRAPGQNPFPVPPVTPVPAFSGTPASELRPTHNAAVPPVQPLKPAAPVQPLTQTQQTKSASGKKKEFFGAGAFALCLVIIGLLSASTGIFAYLYFSLAGVL